MHSEATNMQDAENTEYPTAYHDVVIGNTFYRVTSVFKGEVGLRDILEDLAVHGALRELEGAKGR
jgi:hypothetical protein